MLLAECALKLNRLHAGRGCDAHCRKGRMSAQGTAGHALHASWLHPLGRGGFAGVLMLC